MSDNIRFDASKEDARLIAAIVNRYTERAKELGVKPRPEVEVLMDLTATHCNDCPLRLQDMLDADDFNHVAHDIGGIARNLDRTTGKLMNHFLPRFADTSEAA